MKGLDGMSKRVKFPAALLAAGWLLAAPAQAAEICLRAREVDNTVPAPDGKTIDFRMKNGAVWRSTLKGNCSDLKFSGFLYVIRGGIDEICSNMVEINVLRSSQTCRLGDFTKVQAEKPAPK